jgi:hypothetical protein
LKRIEIFLFGLVLFSEVGDNFENLEIADKDVWGCVLMIDQNHRKGTNILLIRLKRWYDILDSTLDEHPTDQTKAFAIWVYLQGFI